MGLSLSNIQLSNYIQHFRVND